MPVQPADWGCCPLDATLGLERDSQSPGVRRLACRFGARLPFARGGRRSGRGRRDPPLGRAPCATITETVGARREAVVAGEIASAWQHGLPPVAGPPPERLYVAVDGIVILSTDGTGREVKVGKVVPVRRNTPWRAAAAGQLCGRAGASDGLRAARRVGGAPARTGSSRGGRRAGGWGRLDLGTGR